MKAKDSTPAAASGDNMVKLGGVVMMRQDEIKLLRDGRHDVGGGLWIYINGTKSTWVFPYTYKGTARLLEIGPFDKNPKDAPPNVSRSLEQARAAVVVYEDMLSKGLDPIEELKAVTDALGKAEKWHADLLAALQRLEKIREKK